MPNWVSLAMRVKAKDKKSLDAFLDAVHSPPRAPGEEGDGDDVAALDFGRVIPRPDALNIDSGGDVSLGLKIYYSNLGDEAAPSSAVKAVLRKLRSSMSSDDTILGWPWVKELNITSMDQLREYLDRERPEVRQAADQAAANIKAYGSPTWYEWSIENWGTKWNASDVQVKRGSPTEVEFTFNTAWSFPTPILAKLVQSYPDLEFSGEAYEESNEWNAHFDRGELHFVGSLQTNDDYEITQEVREVETAETIDLAGFSFPEAPAPTQDAAPAASAKPTSPGRGQRPV